MIPSVPSEPMKSLSGLGPAPDPGSLNDSKALGPRKRERLFDDRVRKRYLAARKG